MDEMVIREARVWLFSHCFATRAEAFRLTDAQIMSGIEGNHAGGWAGFVSGRWVGGREAVTDSVLSDGLATHFHRRTINGVTYVFKRVEDTNRNAYVEACDDQGNTLHLWRGKATGELPTGVVFAQELGKRLGFF